MSRWLHFAFRPVERLKNRLLQAVKGKVVNVIRFALQPTQAELRTLNEKMDRILDINLAPDVLQDFRRHNQTLRAILADCEQSRRLMGEMNPMFNSFLRDLMRLQLQTEELARLLEEREAWAVRAAPEAISELDAA